MKKIISLLLAILILPLVDALGIGIINNMDFGQVAKGEIYIRELKIWVMDKNYIPYTEIPVPEDNEVLIKVKCDDPNLIHPDEILWHANEYTDIEVTLNIPKNLKKGIYEDYVCGYVCSDPTGGIGFCLGVCANLKYEVVPKGQVNSVGNLNSKKVKWKLKHI